MARMKYFTVELPRTDTFPTDMLRFDEAFPAMPEDAAMIAKLSRQDDIEIMALPRMVRVRLGSAHVHAPNVARWESFAVRVVQEGD